MKSKDAKFLLIAILSFLPSSAISQSTGDLASADSVLRKYVDALGSEMAISAMDPLTIKGEISTVGEDTNWAFTASYKGDSFWYRKERFIDARRRVVIEGGHSDGTSWYGPAGRMQVMDAPSLDEWVLSGYERFGNPRFGILLANYSGAVKVLGREDVHDKQAYKLEFTDPNGLRYLRYFDVKSGLLMMSVSFGIQGERKRTNEYQEIDGVQFVKERVITLDGRPHSTIKIVEVIPYENVDEERFSPPTDTGKTPE